LSGEGKENMIKDNDWTYEYICKLFSCDIGKDGEKLRDEKIEFINKPLYKYCYVCEESARTESTIDYNIDNFEKDLLFFQNPIKFNDPFDCYLGFSQSQVIRDLLIQGLKIKKQLTPQNKKIIAELFKEDETIPEITFDVLEPMIPLIFGLLPQENSIQAEYQEIVKEILANNPGILNKIISNTLTILDQQKIIDELYSNPIFIKIISGTVKQENLDFILKAAPNDMKFKVENEINGFMPNGNGEVYGIFDFIKLCLTSISNEFSVNEIDDIKQKFNEASKDVLVKSRKLISEQFKVTCLSERRESPLMWSHYANKHYGFCVEYDFTGTITTRRYPDLLAAQLFLFPVHYSEKRPLLSKALFDGKFKMDLLKKKTLPPDFLKQLMYGLLFKSEDWSYEREWRIFQLPSETPVMRLPKARKVFLGANIEENARTRIIEIANKKNIPVYQMFLKSDKYKFDYYQVK
jgi:hypothetical protein